MGNLFKPKTPDPTPMPDENGPAVKEAKQREQEQIMTRSGRTSTVLEGGDKLYSNSLLGS